MKEVLEGGGKVVERAIGPHTEADKPGQPAQLAQLLAALPGMPQEPLLQCCICYLITRYGDWLARGLRQEAAGGPGAGQPGALRGVLLALLQLAVRDLELPEASSAASCALLDMCCQCAPFLGEAVQPLLQLYQQLLGAGAVGQAAAAGGGPSGQGAAPGGAKPSGIAGVAEEDVHTMMAQIWPGLDLVYSLSEVLKVWGAEAASIGPVAEALTLLLQHATQQLTTYQQISSNPELMDDTFLLALRALTYSPRLLLGSQATSPGSQLPSSCLPALMECVTQGVLVQHREACMSVLSFLMRLLSRSLLDEVPDAASVLQALLAPLLGALLLMAGREGVAWVTAALESLPNNTVGAADKQAFASAATFVGSHAACAGGPGSLPPAAERGWEG
ncbi:importin N-terminal domain-containing protein, partial [Haematococcus lacustris]